MSRENDTTDRSIGRRPFLKLAGAGAATVTGVGTAAHGNDRAHANSGLTAVRRATRQYHDVATAVADGYVNTHEFAPHMGVHFINPGRIGTSSVDAEQPEILLYEPHETGNGDTRYTLVGVEYYTPTAAVDERPTVLGQPMRTARTTRRNRCQALRTPRMGVAREPGRGLHRVQPKRGGVTL